MIAFEQIENGACFGFWEQGQYCIYRKYDATSAEFLERDGALQGGVLTDFDPDYMVIPLTEPEPAPVIVRHGGDVSRQAEKAYWSNDVPF